MPNKRAAGVKVRHIPLHDDLWQAAKEKAASEGRSVSEVIRDFLSGWTGLGSAAE
jgi:hypothetical protein